MGLVIDWSAKALGPELKLGVINPSNINEIELNLTDEDGKTYHTKINIDVMRAVMEDIVTRATPKRYQETTVEETVETVTETTRSG